MNFKYFIVCKVCDKRTPYCHKNCKEYAVAKIMAERDKAREKTRKETERLLDQHEYESTRRMLVKKNDRKRKKR